MEETLIKDIVAQEEFKEQRNKRVGGKGRSNKRIIMEQWNARENKKEGDNVVDTNKFEVLEVKDKEDNVTPQADLDKVVQPAGAGDLKAWVLETFKDTPKETNITKEDEESQINKTTDTTREFVSCSKTYSHNATGLEAKEDKGEG